MIEKKRRKVEAKPKVFTFEFEGISDRLDSSRLHITDHGADQKYTIQVAVDDRDFLDIRERCVSSGVADLIDLAVAISEADRWAKRHVKVPTRIHVRLPLRQPEDLMTERIQRLLERLTYWYTGDTWTFEFLEFDKTRRVAELQKRLWEAPQHDVPVEVALCSGGLDSLAGLCNRIFQQDAERFLLFGAGGNFGIRGVQKKVMNELRTHLPSADISLTQLAIRQSKTRQKGLKIDPHQRARGLVFILLGCAFAFLEGQHSLAIYENGIGAINLPFRASEVGLDHSRAVHPLSLLLVSELVSAMFGVDFLVHNPFMFWTKGEMCRILQRMNLLEVVWRTVSCDRRHRKQTTECGRCSSCVLRRQALCAVGIDDHTGYLVHIETDEALNRLMRSSHLPAMLFQVSQLRSTLVQPNAWQILSHQHPSLLSDLVVRLSAAHGIAETEIIDEVLSLLRRYTDEWETSLGKKMFDSEFEQIKRTPRRAKRTAQLVVSQ